LLSFTITLSIDILRKKVFLIATDVISTRSYRRDTSSVPAGAVEPLDERFSADPVLLTLGLQEQQQQRHFVHLHPRQDFQSALVVQP